MVKYLNPSFDKCYTYHLGAGYHEFISNDDFVIYPNPAGEILTIEYNGYLKDATFRILDINGRILMTGDLARGQNQFQITGGPGMYAVLIVDAKGKVSGFRKIVRK